MHITVIGTGYVGLVSGTCFADSGNEVTCIDVDAEKVAGLNRGRLPIYEPGLGELVQRNRQEGRLRFSTDLVGALEQSRVVFVAVGTPQAADGRANLSAVWAVARDIRQTARQPKLVVIKSTVPVGTNRRFLELLNQPGSVGHESASNPEFLKEGHAIGDFAEPERVVVGVRSPEAAAVLHDLYKPFLRADRPFLVMTPESAEMTKYVANALLATKISFINEMANLCEDLSADIQDVRRGIGHDSRIGFQFLSPGPGYGGSCFPKDVRALIATAEDAGHESSILRAVDQVNQRQKTVLAAKVRQLLGPQLRGKTLAIWGLAFKPSTDDVREAPALDLIRELLQAGAQVRVHDPEAMDNVRAIFGSAIEYCPHLYDPLDGAEALVIVTDWQEFRHPDFDVVRGRLRRPLVIDGRNLFDPAEMQRQGFTYACIGRQPVGPETTQARRAA